jgi:ribonuclease HI
MCYLGVIIDQHLNWKAQYAHVISKGASWSSQIRRIARPSWGATPKYTHKLFISVALPKILYSIDIWCGPPIVGHPGPKDKGSARIVRQLTQMQCSGTLAITGAFQSAPTDTLNTCSFLPPAIHTIEKWCHQAAVRLASVPAEHSLHNLVKHSTSRYIRRHWSPLHTMFSHFKFNQRCMEKIPFKPCNPAHTGELPFVIKIPPSKEASIEEAMKANERVQVYSDGSAANNKVGAAAILICPGKLHCTLHHHLGPASEHTVHEAELVGILLALQLVKSEKKGQTSFLIGMDNQAALAAFKSDMRSPAHSLAREALRQGNMIQKSRNKKKYSLTLQWTAGHKGILGNELADMEAKCAAEGLTSDATLLPPHLKRMLATNASAVKQKYNHELKQRWINEWRSSKRGQVMLKIDDSSPSPRFLHAISNPDLSHKSASLISQLLTMHIPLNKYLKRIKKVNSARCPSCGTSPETVRHFLLKCPGYAYERWTLENRLKKKRKTLTLEHLLGDAELMIPLVNYIEATHRFTYTP